MLMSESKFLTIANRYTQLRNIFTVHPGVACETHDLLECKCDGLDPSESSDHDIDENVDVDMDSDSENTGFVVASEYKSPKLHGKKSEVC